MKKAIQVKARIEEDGLSILIDNWSLPIIYPREVWRAYPDKLKEVLRDNIALSSTYFVPQMLNSSKIVYDTSRPISEAFLFKNGIYDMASSAMTDNRSSMAYIKKFLNTTATFRDNKINVPLNKYETRPKKQKRIVIPFTFGKDSLLTTAIAQEIELQPHLVYFVEPTHAYEYRHKKALCEPFYKETGLAVQEVQYEPGKMRYGHLWHKQTELGWGLQTTEYVLMSLPFLYFWKAQYAGLGNERSCNESGLDEEGVLTHWSAYDQHPDWTSQQSLLASLIGGRKIRVISLVEPLHEIAEIAILHRRYPALGKFQTSCLAINRTAKNNRWCQNCEKCGSMYAFMKAFNLDVGRVGITENLFDKNHLHLYKNLFARKDDRIYYAVEEEVFLALYLASQRGAEGAVLEKFKKSILPVFKRSVRKYVKEFMNFYPAKNLPDSLAEKIYPIYDQELTRLRNEVKGLLRL